MIEIARGQADAEGIDVRFEVADMETVDAGGAFDACLMYDALHHSDRPDRVLRCARRALRRGGVVLLAEPNWKQRFQGRSASRSYGTTERGYTPAHLKRALSDAGFARIERFHNNRKRLYGNSPKDVAAHVAEPLVYRALAPFWTQIWLRGVAV